MQPNPNSAFVDDAHFEIEVRRVAKLIWPQANFDRSPIVDGYERDAIIQTAEIIIVIEATTSRRKDKAGYDAKKTNKLVKKIRTQGFACQGLLVTLNEPTADQEAEVKPYKGALQLQSFDQFLSRLFDASQYLQVRLSKPFGSIQNPKDAHFALGREFYIPIPIRDEQNVDFFSAEGIAAVVKNGGGRFALLADFGSGKSMFLRETFYLLRDDFIRKRHSRVPIYVNLRDHSGAKYPDEILERHARDLGLPDTAQLVKAWRGGFVDLLLDGFDELAATGWSILPFKLRQLRRTMLEAVRKLIAESPKGVGIVVVGRQHYFDSVRELRDALGLGNEFRILRIDSLSEEDAARIVRKYGGQSVPDWVPSRALLLSYLAAKEFLREIQDAVPMVNSRGHGWDALLRMICAREAKQHPAVDADGVLAFLERLATLGRRTADGLGSFSESNLAETFQDTCGFAPDDAARILISRIPALAVLPEEPGRRRLVDPDIADAARAGDIYRFTESPYDLTVQGALKDAQCSMGSNGLERLSYLAETQNLQATKLEIAAERAAQQGNSVAALDILQLMMDWNVDYHKARIDLIDIQFETMTFEDETPDFSRINFNECMVDNLVLPGSVPKDRLPRFTRCLIGSIDGIATIGDLSEEVFIDCEVSEFSNSFARNAGILATDLPLATKVLLTVLNKLFNQAGRGRKENAFSRGLEPRARGLVPEILGLVARFGFAAPTRMRNQTIWLPKRDKSRRVGEILNKPTTSQDPLIESVRNI